MGQPGLPVQLDLLGLKDYQGFKVFKGNKVYLGQSDPPD
jgi:hypothetical protein